MDIHLRRRFKALTRVVAAAAVLAATASVPEPALAQQAADPSGITGFAGGSVLFTIQPLAPPAGGDPAWGLEAKAASVSAVLGVGRRVGIGLEITRGPEQTASVQFRCCGGTASDSATARETSASRHDTGGAPSRRGYAGLLAFLSTQKTGFADGHHLSAGLGGTGFGAGGVVGGFLKPHVSVEAEARVGPSLTGERRFTYRYRYATVYRDTLFSGFVRWHRRPFQRNLLEPVLGVSVAAGRASRTAVSYSYPGALAEPASDSSVTRISLGVGGGADLVVPVGKGIAAVASFRLHVMKRNDQREGVPELGISRFVYHFGGGLQWSF